ncbi:homocysteine S-methyltransferase [Kribbella sp. VKM Ac-2571]|uniref:homocysteine S-methyltransferase n=1 Tax=Kribbella sp. VKM Ac-2571 TaxID=2512222 RepID=UPI0010F29D00|nr:homocysteine S-methyltransferase [Kribbella sp. VKM Ac-2571]TDO56195.1 homocysteine S-methyltransferase [Kribbella sp. VKM Ac-2571]
MSDHPVILDGGLSNALEDRGHDLSDALWSARLLRDAPSEIAAVHRAYYEAGAMVATTASYQASVVGFERAGVERVEAERLITSSIRIALEVRDEYDDRLVAASVGPYGAMLADGSEYRGRYGVSSQILRDFHGPRLELLANAGPDLLAVETIPDTDEAEVLVELLRELDFPAWFSYSIESDHTRAGQPLTEAFAIPAIDQVVAIGINCCRPSDVRAAVQTAVAVTGKPAVAYPNRGESWDAIAREWVGDCAGPASLAPGWVEAGAAYVGGCCRVGPDDIRALAAGVA